MPLGAGEPVGPAAATVCVAGPVFLDVVMGGLDHAPVPGQEQWVPVCALVPGGSANQAVALGRLGLPTTLVCRLGRDDAGDLVTRMLAREGVDLSWAERVPRQSVTTSLAYEGDRAMTTFGSEQIPSLSTVPRAPTVLVTGARELAADRDTVRSWRSGSATASGTAQGGGAGALVSPPGTPNTPEAPGVSGAPTWVLADVGWDASGRWDPADLDPLDVADAFTPNQAEALHYTGCRDVRAAARALARRVGLVAVTRGHEGVVAISDGHEVSLPAVPVDAVDTTGAGDTFSAGLVWAHLHGLGLRAAVSMAALAAAASVEHPGGSASALTLDELARWTRRRSLPDGYDAAFLDQAPGG